MSPRQTILVALATVFIFAAGVLTGSFITQRSARKQASPATPAGLPFIARVESLNRTAQQLELSTEQRRRIADHVRNAREQISDYFVILEPDIQQVFRQLRQQISSELSPQQRGEFDELLRKRSVRSQERRPGTNAPGSP